MKNTLLITLFILSLSTIQAQETPNAKAEKTNLAAKKNVLKINASSFLLRAGCVQYERAINNNMSLALSLIYRPMNTFSLFERVSNKNSSTSAEVAFMYQNTQLKRLAFTPEIKYYFKGNVLDGLYLSCFARSQNDVTRFGFKYSDSLTQNYFKSATCEVNEKVIGGGCMLGYQLLNRGSLALDIWIAGPYVAVNSYTIKSSFNTTAMTVLEKNYLLQNFSTYNRALKIYMTDNGISTVDSKLGFGFRTLGVNLGIRF